MIPCYSEFRAYALVRQIKSVWRVRKHETQSNRESCVFHFSRFELYFALHSCVLSTFKQHLLLFPTTIYISIYIYIYITAYIYNCIYIYITAIYIYIYICRQQQSARDHLFVVPTIWANYFGDVKGKSC